MARLPAPDVLAHQIAKLVVADVHGVTLKEDTTLLGAPTLYNLVRERAIAVLDESGRPRCLCRPCHTVGCPAYGEDNKP